MSTESSPSERKHRGTYLIASRLQRVRSAAPEQSQPFALFASWLPLARVGWFVVTGFSLLCFVTALPGTLEQLRTGLTLVGMGKLQAQTLIVLAAVICPLFWSTMGVFLFYQTWPRGKEASTPFLLFVSLMLVTVGLALPFFDSSLWTQQPVFRDLLASFLFLASVCLILFIFLFPDGHFAPRWFRIPVGGFILFFSCFYGMYLFPVRSLAVWLQFSLSLITILVFSCSVGSQVYKYVRVLTLPQRRQSRWVMLAILFIGSVNLIEHLILKVFGETASVTLVASVLGTTSFLFLPVAITLALLYDHLWELRPLVSRTLVYALLTACSVGLYVFIVGGLSWFFRVQDNNPLVAGLATGAIAMSFHPLRIQLQRLINRLFYGARDEPHKLITRLGERMKTVLTPEQLFSTIVQTIAQALKLPYVAIALKEEQAFSIRTAQGQCGDEGKLVHFPLVYQHEEIGDLLCLPRPREHALTTRDQHLLQDLAYQIGATVHAVQLTRDLQRARERLVVAHEEERRRLRRDLHDGIGPTLASLSQRIDTASDWVKEDPEEAIKLLRTLRGQVRAMITDLRRLVYALRPPELDEIGLISALRGHAMLAQQSSGVSIRLLVPDTLPLLPAASEVAAFRIIQEALTNVVRHAQATDCQVVLELISMDRLLITITDDGKGLPDRHQAGIGMHTMRERAEELGGRCEVMAGPTGGTCVRVCLPLRLE